MAVDLRLNRYVRNPPPHETEFQRLERRNRERTFLVLFVHDRALSMQCNKQWMLPECELIRNAEHWHEKNGSGAVRPEDVIVAAFVSLRRIAVCPSVSQIPHVFTSLFLPGGNGGHFPCEQTR